MWLSLVARSLLCTECSIFSHSIASRHSHPVPTPFFLLPLQFAAFRMPTLGGAQVQMPSKPRPRFRQRKELSEARHEFSLQSDVTASLTTPDALALPPYISLALLQLGPSSGIFGRHDMTRINMMVASLTAREYATLVPRNKFDADPTGGTGWLSSRFLSLIYQSRHTVSAQPVRSKHTRWSFGRMNKLNLNGIAFTTVPSHTAAPSRLVITTSSPQP